MNTMQQRWGAMTSAHRIAEDRLWRDVKRFLRIRRTKAALIAHFGPRAERVLSGLRKLGVVVKVQRVKYIVAPGY